MLVNRAYRFRLYPMAAQAAELAEWSRQLRFLYNLAHEQRLLALARPRGEQPRVDYYKQSPEMTELCKGGQDQLARVVCCARQEVLRDLDKAWQRWRKGLGGKPHFKRRTDSVRIYFSTQKHWSIEGEGKKARLSFAGAASSVGAITMRMDRAFPKDAKFSSCHITRDVDQWYAVFPLAFEVEATASPRSAVGINRGAVHAIADSDGRVVQSPKHYAKAMERIAKLSRDLARKEPGSRNRYKAAEKLAQAHRKVRRQREWFLHDQSAYYVARYRLIAIEDYATREMTAKKPKPKSTLPKYVKRAINRSILDVGWYEFARQMKYKVQTTGGEVREVPVFGEDADAIGISSVCSACGAALKAPASGHRRMKCEDCGHRELGDGNAARNVLIRAENMTPPGPKTPKASIKIKGRQKRSETAAKPAGEASGRDLSVGGPDEGGTQACTVSTSELPTETHPAMRDGL
jgi:putative transposase